MQLRDRRRLAAPRLPGLTIQSRPRHPHRITELSNVTLWHYADAGHRPQGPLTTDELKLRLADGELDASTLVWREGLAQWQPLGQFLGELEASPATSEPNSASPLPTADPILAAEPSTPVTAAPPAYRDAILSANVVHAGLWRRVAAGIIDGFVTSIASYAVLLPLALLFGIGEGLGLYSSGSGAPSTWTTVYLTALAYTLSMLLPALYFGWMQSSRHQASLGKLACGIKVTRSDGQRLGFWRSFLRYLAYLLFSTLTLGVGLIVSAVTIAFTQRKQAVHDLICDTIVVDRWAFSDYPQRQRDRLDTVSIVVLVLYAGFIVIATAVVALLLVAAGISQR